MKMYLAQFQFIILLGMHKLVHDHGRAHGLGYDGGNGHTCYPHMEPAHKQEVQRNIHKAGNCQIDKGMPGIPHCAQDTRPHIIKQGECHPCKINGQIQGGMRQHLLRHPDGPETVSYTHLDVYKRQTLN